MSPANQSQDQVIKPIVINNPKFTFQWSEPDDHLICVSTKSGSVQKLHRKYLSTSIEKCNARHDEYHLCAPRSLSIVNESCN